MDVLGPGSSPPSSTVPQPIHQQQLHTPVSDAIHHCIASRPSAYEYTTRAIYLTSLCSACVQSAPAPCSRNVACQPPTQPVIELADGAEARCSVNSRHRAAAAWRWAGGESQPLGFWARRAARGGFGGPTLLAVGAKNIPFQRPDGRRKSQMFDFSQ